MLGQNYRILFLVGMTAVFAPAAMSQYPQWLKAVDPGPRPNPSSPIPNPVPGLGDNETALFNESLLRVSELEGTCDTCSQHPQNVLPIDPDPNNPFSPATLVNSAGMGPVFNADQCFICHSQPVIGGSSPYVNPAEKIAHRLGGTNKVPAFEQANGLMREVRFKSDHDGNRDGGVHSLFTLEGRSDAPGCVLAQPDFDKEVANRNIAFRIPLQRFGLGPTRDTVSSSRICFFSRLATSCRSKSPKECPSESLLILNDT